MIIRNRRLATLLEFNSHTTRFIWFQFFADMCGKWCVQVYSAVLYTVNNLFGENGVQIRSEKSSITFVDVKFEKRSVQCCVVFQFAVYRCRHNNNIMILYYTSIITSNGSRKNQQPMCRDQNVIFPLLWDSGLYNGGGYYTEWTTTEGVYNIGITGCAVNS